MLFSLFSDSAPGPDGFSASFFKSCWDIIRSDLMEDASDFMSGKQFPISFGASIIALIPKVDHPNSYS